MQTTEKMGKVALQVWAIPHKERLATLHAICLQISRHISQKCSLIHQVFTPLFVSSDEKFDDASVAQSLCGIAFVFPVNNRNVSNVGLQLLGK